MSMVINDNCINCGACAVECPRDAIFEPNESWIYEGKQFEPLSKDHFFISYLICDECALLKRIRCISVCPMDAIKKYE